MPQNLDVFPTDKYLVTDARVDGLVRRVCGLDQGSDMFYRPVTLGAIPEKQDKKEFVVALAVGVHDCIALPAPDWTGRLDQIGFLQVRREIRNGLAELSQRNTRL